MSADERGVYRVDTPGAAEDNRRTYDTEAEALAAADELIRRGARHCVVWFAGGQEDEKGPEAAQEPRQRPSSAETATGVFGVLRGSQGRKARRSA